MLLHSRRVNASKIVAYRNAKPQLGAEPQEAKPGLGVPLRFDLTLNLMAVILKAGFPLRSNPACHACKESNLCRLDRLAAGMPRTVEPKSGSWLGCRGDLSPFQRLVCESVAPTKLRIFLLILFFPVLLLFLG